MIYIGFTAWGMLAGWVCGDLTADLRAARRFLKATAADLDRIEADHGASALAVHDLGHVLRTATVRRPG